MRKEDTYTLLGTLFSDTLAWVSGKRKSPKVLNLRTFLIFFRLYQAVRTGLEPATPGVTGLYSNQLNYRTFFHLCIKQPLLFSIASANVGRFFESANILSKKEKKFCINYFVAVIRNSEWEGWREQWEMENKSWEKMCFFDFFINFGLS